MILQFKSAWTAPDVSQDAFLFFLFRSLIKKNVFCKGFAAEDDDLTKDLSEKSFRLVETLSHQLAKSFSEGLAGERSSLVKAARLHILATASVTSIDVLTQDLM